MDFLNLLLLFLVLAPGLLAIPLITHYVGSCPQGALEGGVKEETDPTVLLSSDYTLGWRRVYNHNRMYILLVPCGLSILSNLVLCHPDNEVWEQSSSHTRGCNKCLHLTELVYYDCGKVNKVCVQNIYFYGNHYVQDI